MSKFKIGFIIALIILFISYLLYIFINKNNSKKKNTCINDGKDKGIDEES